MIPSVSEVYEKLGLDLPVVNESNVYDTSLFRQELGRKCIGSTTSMVIEAALDQWAFHERGIERESWVMVFDEERCPDGKGDIDLASKVLGQLEAMGCLYTSFQFHLQKSVRTWTHAAPDHRMVYVDHHVLDPDHRVIGPQRLIRAAKEEVDGTVVCTDRDEGVVCRVFDLNAMERILQFASCPIHVTAYLGKRSMVVGGHELELGSSLRALRSRASP